jgi:lipopolysaccharide export system protein LptA
MNRLMFFLMCCIWLFITTTVQAQTGGEVEIVQAGSLEGVKRDGVEVRRLIGDVIFKRDSTYLYCDSALFYDETNSIDAYSRVRIVSTTARINGDFLHYDGQLSLADITGKKVTLDDGKMQLTATAIRYDLNAETASYTTGGKVVDKSNVLTSRKADYFAKQRSVYFKDDVVLVNPDYRILSDTLRYHPPSQTTYFLGPTWISGTTADSVKAYCEFGWYRSNDKKAVFTRNARVSSKERILTGDSISYDFKYGSGLAWENVSIHDTLEKVVISGGIAGMNEKTGQAWVTRDALLTRIFDTDSLFMHADTLRMNNDTLNDKKSYRAYYKVRMFKSDLQAQCDSVAYSTLDSTIWFFRNPVLWGELNQLTADTIGLVLRGDTISEMRLLGGAFIAGQEDSIRFNQVKGRRMDGTFIGNRLQTIYVTGNGESVYYLRNSRKQLSGVNAATCSDMRIRLIGSKVSKIWLLNKPDAVLNPVKDVNPLELRLKGFGWRGNERPQKKEDIFNWPLDSAERPAP